MGGESPDELMLPHFPHSLLNSFRPFRPPDPSLYFISNVLGYGHCLHAELLHNANRFVSKGKVPNLPSLPSLPPSDTVYWECHLADTIVPDKCKLSVGKVRAELKLKKANLIHWSEYEVSGTSQ